MWTTPEKHTKKRETLEMLNGTKPQEELGTRRYINIPTPHPSTRNHSDLKEPDEMLNKTKTLTTIARQKKAKEKALKWTSQTGKEPYENPSEKNRTLQNTKKNNR